MFPSRRWRELYDALLSRQSGGRAERDYLGMLALALEHGLEKIEEKSCASVWPMPDSTRCVGNSARPAGVVVDFRADLSSYDTMIAAAEQEEVCQVETDATGLLLSDFGLTTMVRELKGIEERAQAGGWSFRRTLRELLETEAAERGQRRLLRLLKDFRAARRQDAGRPGGKPSECARTPTVGRTLRRSFRREGRQRAGLRSAGPGQDPLPERGGLRVDPAPQQTVLFVPSYKLIQRLLEAKRELKLEALLKKLDGYAVIILDDLGIRAANPRGDGSALHLLRRTL